MWNYTPKQIADLLLRRSQDVCEHLLGRGKKCGHHELGYADISGAPGDSLKINLKNGKWCDFASPDPGGDLLELWRQARRVSCADAMLEAAQFLGITLADGFGEPAVSRKYVRPSNRNLLKLVNSQQPGYDYLRARGLTDNTLKAFRICELSSADMFPEVTNNPGTIAYPYLVTENGKLTRINTKYIALARKPNGDKILKMDAHAKAILFGWPALQELVDTLPRNHPWRRSVCLTEGEIDCMTLWQYGIPALSLPNGATSIDNWLPHEYDHLMAFDWIYLVLDNDDAGRAGTEKLIERLGEDRIKNVILPHKDVNECWQQGMTAEQMVELLNASKPVLPKSLVLQEDIFERTYLLFHPELVKVRGFSVPWEGLQKYIRFAPSELTIWAGYTGHGKTTIINHVLCDALYKDDSLRVFIASFEMPPQRIMQLMYQQITHLNVPSDGYLQKLKHELTERIILTERSIISNDVDDLLSKMTYAFKRFGVTHFVVDNLGVLSRKNSSRLTQNQLQDTIIQLLIDFAHRHDVHVHLAAHNKKPEPYYDRNNSRMLEVYNVSGSGNIVNWSANVLVVERNGFKESMLQRYEDNPQEFVDDEKLRKDYDKALAAPDAYLSVMKSCEFGQRKKIGLWFHQDCGQFTDAPNGRYRYSQYAGDTVVPLNRAMPAQEMMAGETFDDLDEVI